MPAGAGRAELATGAVYVGCAPLEAVRASVAAVQPAHALRPYTAGSELVVFAWAAQQGRAHAHLWGRDQPSSPPKLLLATKAGVPDVPRAAPSGGHALNSRTTVLFLPKGGGNVLNVQRTVRNLITAGCKGCFLEDQVRRLEDFIRAKPPWRPLLCCLPACLLHAVLRCAHRALQAWPKKMGHLRNKEVIEVGI